MGESQRLSKEAAARAHAGERRCCAACPRATAAGTKASVCSPASTSTRARPRDLALEGAQPGVWRRATWARAGASGVKWQESLTLRASCRAAVSTACSVCGTKCDAGSAAIWVTGKAADHKYYPVNATGNRNRKPPYTHAMGRKKVRRNWGERMVTPNRYMFRRCGMFGSSCSSDLRGVFYVDYGADWSHVSGGETQAAVHETNSTRVNWTGSLRLGVCVETQVREVGTSVRLCGSTGAEICCPLPHGWVPDQALQSPLCFASVLAQCLGSSRWPWVRNNPMLHPRLVKFFCGVTRRAAGRVPRGLFLQSLGRPREAAGHYLATRGELDRNGAEACAGHRHRSRAACVGAGLGVRERSASVRECLRKKVGNGGVRGLCPRKYSLNSILGWRDIWGMLVSCPRDRRWSRKNFSVRGTWWNFWQNNNLLTFAMKMKCGPFCSAMFGWII